MSFSIIAAVANNGVIGKDNRLPWYIFEDTKHFYKLVHGKTVVMGHNTYDSIGHPLKGSKNIVISHNRSLKIPVCLVLHSVQEVLDLYQNGTQEIMVIGGESIYEQFLPFVDKMYLTLIHSDIDGDVYFPNWKENEWEVISKRDSRSDLYFYSFVVLERK